MSTEIPLSVQIGEVEREIRMRQNAYPGLIEKGRMKAVDARRQIAIMQEVLSTLEEQRAIQLAATR